MKFPIIDRPTPFIDFVRKHSTKSTDSGCYVVFLQNGSKRIFGPYTMSEALKLRKELLGVDGREEVIVMVNAQIFGQQRDFKSIERIEIGSIEA